MADVDISTPFDAVSVQESVDLDIFYFTDVPTVYDGVTVSEYVKVNVVLCPHVYDEVTVDDEPTVWTMHIYTNPAGLYRPLWTLEASFGDVLVLNEQMPVRDCEGYFGSRLVKNIPGRTLEASVTIHPVMNLSEKMPAYRIDASFGSRLVEKIPVWEAELEISYPEFATLRKTMPGWKIEATMIPGGWMKLEKWIPMWSLEGSIKEEDILRLDERMPVWKGEASALAGVAMELDERWPVWDIDASLFSGNMTLDVSMPAWLMDGVGTGDDTSGAGAGGSMTDKTRFTDYILRYERP